MNFYRFPALILTLFVLSTQAQTPDNADEKDEHVETITVTGTRTEQNVDGVALTISVYDKEQIERELARNIVDLIRYEPGVSVGGTGSRFGLTDFNIRGIGGNRVLTVIDGVRVPDEFSFGPFLSSRRDFVDIDSVQRVEIARGPISSLWGSDAIGGVVAFSTIEPQTYLDDGKKLHTGLKVVYSGADSGNTNALTLAGGEEKLAGLLRYTHRSASELSNAGSIDTTGPTREIPDPQSINSQNLVLKGSVSLNEANKLTLTLDQFESEIDSQILSDYGVVVFGTTVNSRDATDRRNRDRVSLDYRYKGSSPFADDVRVGMFRQASDSEQRTREDRTTPSRQPQTRERNSWFDQSVRGFFAQVSKDVKTNKLQHTITFGADYSFTKSSNLRDGGTYDSAGMPQFEFSALPTRDFPTTEVTQFALFLQDEISLIDDRFTITPSIRFDQFSFEAIADDIYRNGNLGQGEPEDYETSETSAKLAGIFSITSNLAVYANYSQGFRAPPYDDVNVGFANLLGGYKTISNTELESESSEGIEVGFRLKNESDFIQLSTFKNDYRGC